MQLSLEERERIYLEEKMKREEDKGTSFVLLALTIGAMLGLAAVLTVASGLHERDISLEDLRKAYAGLGPDDEGQES